MKIKKESKTLDFTQLKDGIKYVAIGTSQGQYLNHVFERVNCEYRRGQDSNFVFSNTVGKDWVKLLSKEFCMHNGMRFVEQGKEGYVCEITKEELSYLHAALGNSPRTDIGSELYNKTKEALNG